ncbi:MAG: hypothetical protein J6W75_06275 [Bacteroidaceae bacterium]|nr:hypothetical protein [Bacteroidaceae bacterium]
MYVTDLIAALGICVVLPIIVVSLITRAKTNATNRRAEIAMAAIEKNTNVDLEEFFRKMNPPRRSIKERLLNRLLLGCIFTLFGLGVYIAIFVYNMNVGGFDRNMFIGLSIAAVPSLGIGLAFLINYFIGRRILKQEMEAEAKSQA